MTSDERLLALCDAVDYVVANRIPGDFAECGIWRGGSSMAAASSFLRHGRTDVHFYLFDTFEGMPEPTANDVRIGSGERASALLVDVTTADLVRAHAPVDVVQQNLRSTGYPADKIHLVKGRVEDTIPAHAPERLSILRLDTDWYASTRHEMEHLFPRLSSGGVLIVDDYGYWAGQRKAIDEYIAAHDLRLFLARIDHAGRIAVKTT